MGGVSGTGGAPDRAAGGTPDPQARSISRRAYPKRRPPPGGWCCFAWNNGVREGGQGREEPDGRCVVM